MQWNALLVLVLAVSATLWLERRVHRQLQQLLLALTRNITLATTLYALVLLPGVALHELSHALVARLLKVRVRNISLRPERLRGGVVRFGYVEVQRSDDVRAALIGLAPLGVGVSALALIGARVFGLEQAWHAIAQATDPTAAVLALVRWSGALLQAPDAWLWLYIAFAVANTMLPSESDLRPWSSNPVVMSLIIGAVALALNAWLALPLAYWLALLFGFTALVNGVVLTALMLLTRLFSASANVGPLA